jgi:hypothetical protein
MKPTRYYVVHSQSGIAHCFLGPQNACGNLLYNSPHLRPISSRLARRLAKQGRFCRRCQRVLERDDYITRLVEMARELSGDRS